MHTTQRWDKSPWDTSTALLQHEMPHKHPNCQIVFVSNAAWVAWEHTYCTPRLIDDAIHSLMYMKIEDGGFGFIRNINISFIRVVRKCAE